MQRGRKPLSADVKARNAVIRFWHNVDCEHGPIHPTLGRCWMWLGSRLTNPYGSFCGMGPHRYSYLLHYPDSLKGTKSLVCHYFWHFFRTCKRG